MSFAGTWMGARGHYPQQTNSGTENQKPHGLTYEWELNDENTWAQRMKETLGPTGGGSWDKKEEQKKIIIGYQAQYLGDEIICTPNPCNTSLPI